MTKSEVNARRQAAPHGFSPEPLQRLLSADWRRPDAAIRLRDYWPELEHQIPFTLLRLGQVARDWRSPKDLANEVVLPFALEGVPVIGNVVDAPWILDMHVLRRIQGFGLVDERRVGNVREYRITPLFHRFLQFDV